MAFLIVFTAVFIYQRTEINALWMNIHNLSKDLQDWHKIIHSVDFTLFEKDPLSWNDTEIGHYFTELPNGTKTNIYDVFQIRSRNRLVFNDYVLRSGTSETWPGNIVPFVFKSNFNTYIRRHLALVFKYIQSRSCIRFKPLTIMLQEYGRHCLEDDSALQIYATTDDLCLATTRFGFNPAVNLLYINENYCGSFADLAHLVLHVLGLDHEFVRHDRDDYVRIVNPDWAPPVFQKEKHQNSHTFLPYNVFSLMHITLNSTQLFSYKWKIDGFQTLRYSVPNNLHPLDMVRLNRVYHCGEHFAACKDEWSAEGCDRLGLGAVYNETTRGYLRFADKAACGRSGKPIYDKCIRTCGECYKFHSEKYRTFEYTQELMTSRPIRKKFWRSCFVREDFPGMTPFIDKFDPHSM